MSVFVGRGGRVLITDSEGAVAPKRVTDTLLLGGNPVTEHQSRHLNSKAKELFKAR